MTMIMTLETILEAGKIAVNECTLLLTKLYSKFCLINNYFSIRFDFHVPKIFKKIESSCMLIKIIYDYVLVHQR